MMRVGCGSDCCLETGSSCEPRTSAAVTDERGLHTRSGDLSFSARDCMDASPKPFGTIRMHPPVADRAILPRQHLLRVSQLEAFRARTPRPVVV